MRRVLLTGASGFVGRHTQQHLIARGFEVHAVHASPGIDWALPEVRPHRCDLLAPGESSALLERIRPSHLLHLAWNTEPGRYQETPENLRWIAASLELLLAFRAVGGGRAVLAGSCAEYDWSHPIAVEAETPLRPGSLYGTAKDSLRAVAERFARNEGLTLGWGRLFFPYGPYEHPARLVASVIRALLAGEEALCTHGEQVRDFIYVDDAAAAFAALLDSEVAGPVNVASGEPHRVKELVGCIAEALGRNHLVRLGARPAPACEVPVLTADVTRLRNEVSFTPSETLVTGVRKCIDWWIAHSGSRPRPENPHG